MGASEDKSSLQERLTPEQFRVTQLKGTEAPFTGAYCHAKDPGTYHCVVCDAKLFASDTKYDSGSGWPSFWDVIQQGAVATEDDRSLFMARTEILCAACGAHLGHVFPDGPQPTGQRYCVNSASLQHRPPSDEG